MYEAIKISLELLKKHKLLFIVVFLISSGVSFYEWNNEEKVYEANYIGAPFYETAADVDFKVKELATAINDNNQAYIDKYLSDSLDVKSVRNATTKKINRPADFTYKHQKVSLIVEVLDSSSTPQWDKELRRFYISVANNPENEYRGREVLEERIKAIAINHYKYDVSDLNEEDQYLKILNYFFNKDSIVVSDSNKIDLVFARYIAELKNSKSVNEIATLTSSYHEVTQATSRFRSFLYIPFGPLLIILFIWSALIENRRIKENEGKV